MIHLMVTYKIRRGQVGEARAQVATLLAAIRKQEPQTLVYQVFHLANHEASFVHFMVFPDAEAQLAHTTAPHVKAFVEALLPFCEAGPDYSDLRLVDSIAALAHPLKPRPDPVGQRHPGNEK